MSVAVTITYAFKVGSQYQIGFKLAFSGSYVSGGDTVNFATATADPSFVGMIAQIIALGAPLYWDVWSIGGQLTDLYFPLIGTTQANQKLKIATALGSELSAGAYPAVVTGDTVVGEATFVSL